MLSKRPGLIDFLLWGEAKITEQVKKEEGVEHGSQRTRENMGTHGARLVGRIRQEIPGIRSRNQKIAVLPWIRGRQ